MESRATLAPILLASLAVSAACVVRTDATDADRGDSASDTEHDTHDTHDTHDAGDPSDDPDPDPDPGPLPEACDLAPDPGMCDAAFERYHFDADTGQCAPFLWGGCEGVVPFETLEACETSCLACSAFTGPQAPDVTADIVLVNATASPIFVDPYDTCSGGMYFNLSRESDIGEEELPLFRGCSLSCADVATTCEGISCPGVCEISPLLRLEPGVEYALTWTAVTYRSRQVPERCASCPDVPSSFLQCVDSEPLETGRYYSFEGTAGSLACDGPDCPNCDPGEDGWCWVHAGEGAIVPERTAVQRLSWPGQPTEVRLVFEET